MGITNIVFKKAERRKAKVKMALTAPAGGGKTHSALLIAAGLVPNGKIAVLDTESGSASIEAGKPNIPAYDVLEMNAPFLIDKYVAAIKAAEAAGYDLLIIDSLSAAWNGEGGLLEMVDNITKASKSGNSYLAWKDVTPLYNKLVNAILTSGIHIIGTMRSKTDYAMTSDNGKMTPKKIGLAPIQREGMDYEFTIVLDIDQSSHLATASKDRTSLFDGSPFKPSVETGALLKEWFEDAANVPDVPFESEPKPPVEPTAPAVTDTPAPVLYVINKIIDQDPNVKPLIPQLDVLRELGDKAGGAKDDENLLTYIDFVYNVKAKKLTDLSKSQVEQLIDLMKGEIANAQ